MHISRDILFPALAWSAVLGFHGRCAHHAEQFMRGNRVDAVRPRQVLYPKETRPCDAITTGRTEATLLVELLVVQIFRGHCDRFGLLGFGLFGFGLSEE